MNYEENKTNIINYQNNLLCIDKLEYKNNKKSRTNIKNNNTRKTQIVNNSTHSSYSDLQEVNTIINNLSINPLISDLSNSIISIIACPYIYEYEEFSPILFSK